MSKYVFSFKSKGPFGSNISVEGGKYYLTTDNSVVYDFSGTYVLTDSKVTGFNKVWKHESKNYWIFNYNKQWRFTTKEPDGYDSAFDFYITVPSVDTTDKWPWEIGQDSWIFNTGYNGVEPTMAGGPDAGKLS